MDIMKNPFSKRNSILTAIIACGLLLAAIYWLLQAPADDILADTRMQKLGTAQSSVATLKSPVALKTNQHIPATAPISGAASSTFMPGVRRGVRPYSGPIDDKGLVPSTVPGWWLYAYSAEEAAWLDKHGYPTPAEAQRLRSSSKQELRQMYDAGDINALAHLATKTMLDMINKKPRSPDDPKYPISGVDVLTMPRLSPYQAIVLAQGYIEARDAYYKTPLDDRTEEQLNILRARVRDAEFASVLSKALGEPAYSAISAAERWSQIDVPGEFTVGRLEADFFVNDLFKVHRARLAAGLPPLDFQKRPTPLDTTQRLPTPTQVLERY